MKIKDIFDLSIGSNGSNFTKTFIKNNSGDIPVYGASKDNEIPSYGYVEDNAVIKEKKNGKIQETNVKYFNDCLTYNIDGFAGYVFYREGKFSLSEKVRPLIIKDEYKNYLIPEYLKFVIEPIFRNNRKGRLGESEKNEYTKLYINMIEDIEIKIPIINDGTFDLEKQREIVRKYKAIGEMKDSILEKGLPFTLSDVQFNGETLYI
jgi:type I restriction-modification system methyltransferase subunit